MGLGEAVCPGSGTRGPGQELEAAASRSRLSGVRPIFLASAFALTACGGGGESGSAYGVPSNPLLTVVPGTLSECGPEAVVAEVSWNASQLGIPSVRVEVGQLGNSEPKVFFVGESRGSMLTEQWVRVGTIFILVDDENGRILDSREVLGVPCL